MFKRVTIMVAFVVRTVFVLASIKPDTTRFQQPMLTIQASADKIEL